MSDRHEALFLLSVLRGDWDDAVAIARERPLRPAAFLSLCRRCDVHPQAHAALQRAGRLDLVGTEAAVSLGTSRAKVRVDNLALLASLARALDVLLAAGIRPVALKGVDVLHRLGTAFDERTLDDIDLLVAPAERDRAIAALEGAGWRGPRGDERLHWLRSSYEMPLVGPGPVPVGCEIHWGLGQEKRYAIDAVEVIARAKPLTIDGRDVLRLDDHDAAAHLLLHHVQHYFDRRLKWALDLATLARQPGFAWSEVARRLGAWRGRGAAGLAMVHLRKLFPGAFGGEAAEALPAATWRLVATLPLRSGHPLDLFRGTRRRFVQSWIAAAALESPRDLAGYLRHRATRDRDPV